jgi:hypothetical protein
VFDGKSSESGFLLFKHYQCHWQVEWNGEYAGVATAIAFGGPDSILDVDGCFWSKYRFCKYFSSNL